jgi:hypothetical protein
VGLWTKTDRNRRQRFLSPSEMRTTVKICFVMDCTASMGPWMKAARDHIQELIYNAREEYPHASFTVAFVGYRDYGSDQQCVMFDFQGPEELVRHIRTIQPRDGEDEAEDVAWGLFHASQLSWDNSDVRMIYHIADAPAHGDFFTQGFVSDRFPEGDPKFLDPRQMIKEWSQRGYHYTFVRITHLTDTMIDHFQNCWTGRGMFRVLDLSQRGPHGFLDTVRESINDTLTQCTSSQDQAEEQDNPRQLSCSSH